MHTIFNLKKIAIITLTLVAYSYSLMAVALSMGDIQVKSTLGQPLLAQVKVTGADSNIDGSCFNVTSEDPENGVMLSYNLSDALITIQSQLPVDKPAMVLTLFNHCQAPSKRNFIFFVNAQESSANNQNPKNETPKKVLGDQFHYQRIFNKLTKQTEQELNARGLPDRFIYEDQARDSRLNSKNAPMPTEGFQTDTGLTVKATASQSGVVVDKASKNAKTADKVTKNATKNATIELKTTSNKSSFVISQEKPLPAPAKPTVENKLALAKTITATQNNTSQLKPSKPKAPDNKTSEIETNSILNTSASSSSESEETVSSNNIIHANEEGDLISAEDSPLIFEEQILAEKRMLELQAQLTELYKINGSLDNLFKKLNHELTQVKKENNFLRLLALCLGSALLMSSYFFADWLRRKKSKPVFEHEPAMWTSPDVSAKPNPTDNQFVVSSAKSNTNTTPENNVFIDTVFVAANNTSTTNSSMPNATEANNLHPLTEEHRLSEKAPEAEWFDLNDSVSKNPEQAIQTTPVDTSETPSPTQPKTAQPPVLTITRVASPITPQVAEPSSANPTTEANTTKLENDVIKLQPAGVMDDVDVFLSHGRTNLAIQLLQNYLMEHPKESAVIWVFLLDLLAKEGKRREYEITTEECRKHFNIKLSDFSVPAANNDSIESFERISAALQKVWGTPLVLSFIDELIYNTRLVPRIGFNRAIFEELMLLRELAEEELRMDQTQIQPTPASMTHRQVSDEFKQLAEDLKTQDQRQQDVNQYLSQFEFNLEDLSK